ncbi:flavin reductase [Desulforamulus ruminis]|uniref:Flavin reductase domain protein FMN-binding protein n=1 Tax=Desulforamulus ruminis (strain ATCC 23193 / DSM 2154 / NCIMB 8452 / DL) TaxID=696281 RepID=F6DN06_DESRL|nr:flavin reductase domain protein FMN-binding protein [Desulforamulus ruminis DSM 2154]
MMTQWRCTVCDYIHEGPEPPEECPVCGVDASHFVKVESAAGSGEECRNAVKKALRQISYGLYVISSRKDGRFNGQCANSVFQVTSEPVQLAVGINKNNLTHEYIMDSRVFVVSVLNPKGLDLVKRFGFQSGRKVDKFADTPFDLGEVEVPLLRDCLANLECRVVNTLDVGTHTLFVGEVVCAKERAAGEPMTYALYHRLKNTAVSPAAESRSLTQWRCKVCGYVHQGEQPPEICPVCGVGPEEFEKLL